LLNLMCKSIFTGAKESMGYTEQGEEKLKKQMQKKEKREKRKKEREEDKAR